MYKAKRNKNYKKNSHMKKRIIFKLIRAILTEKRNTQPHDYLSRNIGNKYAEANHEILGLAGIFKSTEHPIMHTKSGVMVYPDELMTLLPDGEDIPDEVISVIEYLTYKLNGDKVESLYFTTTSVSENLHKNYIIYAVTNYDEGENQKVFKFKAMTVVVNFIFFDKKRIYKILNTLKRKDYTKDEMSVTEFMSFVQAISFVKEPYAKDFIEKSVDFFTTIEKIDDEMRCDLFLALKLMIRHYFERDRKKLWRLLEMAIKALHDPETDVFVGSRYPDQLDYMKGILIDKDNELVEKNKRIAFLEDEIERLTGNKPN